MSDGPDFRELVGGEGSPDELARLRRVHDLLVAAGPPPELPPALARPPEQREGRLLQLPRRRLGAVLTLAAALAAVFFGVGYLVGHRGSSGFQSKFALRMQGTRLAPDALGSLQVAARDKSGNWPLLVRVQGLRPLPRGAYYELLLTRRHGSAVSCGTFAVHPGTTIVYLNAPYELKHFTGWVVTLDSPGGDRKIVMRTPGAPGLA